MCYTGDPSIGVEEYISLEDGGLLESTVSEGIGIGRFKCLSFGTFFKMLDDTVILQEDQDVMVWTLEGPEKGLFCSFLLVARCLGFPLPAESYFEKWTFFQGCSSSFDSCSRGLFDN